MIHEITAICQWQPVSVQIVDALEKLRLSILTCSRTWSLHWERGQSSTLSQHPEALTRDHCAHYPGIAIASHKLIEGCRWKKNSAVGTEREHNTAIGESYSQLFPL